MLTVRDLGAALHKRRIDLGLNQEQVCQKAGVARSWLSKLETGKHPGAEVQKVLDVAAALDLTVSLTPAPAVSRDADLGADPFSGLFNVQP